MYILNKPIDSICILRLSSIGDITHIIPVVLCIQQQCPNTKITWIIGKTEFLLIGDLPGVEFIVLDKTQFIKSYFNLKKQLKKRSFDVLLHMQVSLRANFVSLLISAKIKIGYDKNRSRNLHQLFVNMQINAVKEQHVRECFLSFLEPIGVRVTRNFFEDGMRSLCMIPFADKDLEFAKKYLLPQQYNIIFSPCSRHKMRNWLPERYAAVADYAIYQYNANVIFVGGPDPFDKKFVDEIISYMQYPSINLVAKDTLKQLTALLSVADLLISPDSGPAHIAGIVGTDVIGLYAASNPNRTGPYTSLKWCVNRYPDAIMKYLNKTLEECRWGTKIELHGVMNLITTDDVTSMLDRWMRSFI